MKEYVEKDRVIGLLGKNWRCNVDANDAMQESIDDVRKLPAADVREVVRGEWIMNDECRTVCSLCGNVVAFVSHADKRWEFGNFCPNCGADMRREIEHETNSRRGNDGT